MAVSFSYKITFAVAVSLFFNFLFATVSFFVIFLAVSLFVFFVAVSLFKMPATVSFFQNFISSAAVSLLFDLPLNDSISAESCSFAPIIWLGFAWPLCGVDQYPYIPVHLV